MRLKAYVLAADPTWIEASVAAYYPLVEEIVVSYDRAKRGWTGAPIPVDECLQRLQAIDTDGKLRLLPGDYARLDHTPMENDTYQRQRALDAASAGADWVLQFDTDEVLPNTAALLEMLAEAERRDIPAVEWPMRVLFRALPDGQMLQVCARDGGDRFEYPGPIAVRPGVTLTDARRAAGPFMRPVVPGDNRSLQLRQPQSELETRVEMQSASDAILHNSWGRSAASIRSKIASWGHSEGLKSWLFYYVRWKPAPYLWRVTRNFHPFARGLWPALKPCENLPDWIPARSLEEVA